MGTLWMTLVVRFLSSMARRGRNRAISCPAIVLGPETEAHLALRPLGPVPSVPACISCQGGCGVACHFHLVIKT